MDEEIRQLLAAGKKLEAVRLVHKSLDCTLQEAKDYVDRLEHGATPTAIQRTHRGWNIVYKNHEPVKITVTDDYGTHELRPGTAEWDAVLAESRQEGHGRMDPRKPSWWQRLLYKDGDKSLGSSVFVTHILVFLLLVFSVAFLYVLFYAEDFCEGYVGMVRFLIFVGFCMVWACQLFIVFRTPSRKWYVRYPALVLSLVCACLFVVTASSLVIDLVGNRLQTYEGRFRLGEDRSRKYLFGYFIKWESDRSFSFSKHYITTEHYRQLQKYDTARVLFWENTGVVKSVVPRSRVVAE